MSGKIILSDYNANIPRVKPGNQREGAGEEGRGAGKRELGNRTKPGNQL